MNRDINLIKLSANVRNAINVILHPYLEIPIITIDESVPIGAAFIRVERRNSKLNIINLSLSNATTYSYKNILLSKTIYGVNFKPTLNKVFKIPYYSNEYMVELFITFLIAHEIGHVIDEFINSKEYKSDISFNVPNIRKHLVSYETRHIIQKTFIISVLTLISRLCDKINDKYRLKKHLVYILQFLYRKLPKERIADDIALKLLSTIDLNTIIDDIYF